MKVCAQSAYLFIFIVFFLTSNAWLIDNLNIKAGQPNGMPGLHCRSGERGITFGDPQGGPATHD